MNESKEKTAFLCEENTLQKEFPEYAIKVDQLRNDDSNFASMEKKYHELNKKIRKLETRDIPTSDKAFEELKKNRLHIKDQLYQILQKG